LSAPDLPRQLTAPLPLDQIAQMARNDLPEGVRTKLEGLVGSADTVLFMKGTKMMPQCGFSARVVSILQGLGHDFETVNVLADSEVREGMKLFSDWPTFPQLYHKGKLIGGCDIVSAMAEQGQLAEALSA
jgi:monothiol glutaredoxin